MAQNHFLRLCFLRYPPARKEPIRIAARISGRSRISISEAPESITAWASSRSSRPFVAGCGAMSRREEREGVHAVILSGVSEIEMRERPLIRAAILVGSFLAGGYRKKHRRRN